MRAFAFTKFGEAPAIHDVDLPEPGEGEVRVQVRAASVNGFDLSVASGRLEGMMEHQFPVVIGKDFAGTVDAVGAGVEDYQVGDRVFGVVTKPFLGDGSFAEYVTVPTSVGIAKLPEGVDFLEGATLGLAGTAALDAFDASGISEGTTVLVAGATGGVGQQALQLAVRAGAHVVATASSDEEKDLVTRLGAAQTVDYKADVVAQVKDLHPEGVDVVLNFAGNPAALVPAIAANGKLVSTLIMSPTDVNTEEAGGAAGIEVVSIYANPAPATLERLARNQADKHTAVTVQHVFDLEQAATAFEQFTQGTLGKLAITIN